MTLIYADRLFEVSMSTGTGDFALTGATTGYRAFSAVCSISDTIPYVIFAVDSNGNPSGAWEVGIGTYSALNTLARTTVQASSNGGAAVNFSAGTKWVLSGMTATQAAGFLKQGKHTIPVMAGAMTTRSSAGAATGSTETSTNKVMVVTLDFDQSTDEFAQFAVTMPKSWNEGTVTAVFYWTSTAASGDVAWGIQGVAISNDDVVDAAFGTAVTVIDSVTAANDLMVTAETSAMTLGGSPVENDLAVFQVYRDADNASDTLAADAKLIGLKLLITYNAADDA